jgi:hypothetical protein
MSTGPLQEGGRREDERDVGWNGVMVMSKKREFHQISTPSMLHKCICILRV